MRPTPGNSVEHAVPETILGEAVETSPRRYYRVREYPCVWVWRNRAVGLPGLVHSKKVPWFGDGVDRVGQACRVIARGTMNTALIEFENGDRVVTSRGGLRRRGPS